MLLTAINPNSGSTDLRDVANVYETLGKFLSDLNLLSEVRSSCMHSSMIVLLLYVL